jgi:hypothetical protein
MTCKPFWLKHWGCEKKDMLNRLLRSYAELEKKYSINYVIDIFKNLTRANGNGNFPIQRWYNCKESYSISLLNKLIDFWEIDVSNCKRILDSFVGIGTTLLSVQHIHKTRKVLTEGVGIEINPFFHFVSSVKVNWHKYDIDRIEELAKNILNTKELPEVEIPQLTTLNNERVYKKAIIKKILGYRNLVNSYSNEIESDVLLLGLSSVLEQLSGIRKDGRALRFVKNKKIPVVEKALKIAWDRIVDDLKVASKIFSPLPCKILLGDGRELLGTQFSMGSLGRFDMILCSPPYLNNIDYSEVYKIELWMLDFIKSYGQFRDLRHRTFRSHPSVKFSMGTTIRKKSETSNFIQHLDNLINALPNDHNFKWRSRLFEQYFDDVYTSLKKQYEILKDDRWTFWVIGNSMHGSRGDGKIMIPIATDLLIATIAEEVGFTVKGLLISRKLRRRSYDPRSNRYLRETIITLKKN